MSEIINYVNSYDGNIPLIFNPIDFKTHQDIGNATIQYVDTRVSTLIADAPAVLDTIQEIANALNNDGNLYNTLDNRINLKADSSTITNINTQITNLQNNKVNNTGNGNINGNLTISASLYTGSPNSLYARMVQSGNNVVIFEAGAPLGATNAFQFRTNINGAVGSS
jgi:hypothetical protein